MKSLRLIHHEISSDIGYGAQELVGLQPDIILTHGTPATVALQRETRTIPIAFATGSGPVEAGIVARLEPRLRRECRRSWAPANGDCLRHEERYARRVKSVYPQSPIAGLDTGWTL